MLMPVLFNDKVRCVAKKCTRVQFRVEVCHNTVSTQTVGSNVPSHTGTVDRQGGFMDRDDGVFTKSHTFVDPLSVGFVVTHHRQLLDNENVQSGHAKNVRQSGLWLL